MVGMHYDPRAMKIGEKFLECKHHSEDFLFSYSVVLVRFIQEFTRIIDRVKDFISSLS